jgi:hypothetical protein
VKPSLPVERVHLDLMQRLPVRIVHGKPNKEAMRFVRGEIGKRGQRLTPEEKEQLRRRITRMRSAGVEREHIADALGISLSCVDRQVTIFNAAKAAQRR